MSTTKTTITTVMTRSTVMFLIAAKFLMMVAALMTMAMELAAMMDSMVTFIATVMITMGTLLKSWSPAASTLEAIAWIVLFDNILELFIMHTSRADEAAPEVAASDSTQKVDPPTKEASLCCGHHSLSSAISSLSSFLKAIINTYYLF